MAKEKNLRQKGINQNQTFCKSMLKAYSEEEKTGNNDKAIFDYIYYKALPGY
jgi:hypothetical protein